MRTGPHIYVACLEAYNNGMLHGEWIDAAQDVDGIREDVQRMLADSPMSNELHTCEEWAIHDYENFEGLRVDEWSPLEYISEVALAMNEMPEPGLLCGILDHLGSGTSVQDAKDYIDDNYRGTHESLEHYAEEYFNDTHEKIDDWLYNYIDFERMGRDFEYGGDIFTISVDAGLAVFSNT